jgi:UDP-N-acetylglucosamine transferase subunit ALG13
MDTISANVPTIVWPRLSRFGEAANDHQLEIAEVLSQQGRVLLVNDADQLFAALRSSDLPLPRTDGTKGGGLVEALRDSLTTIRQERMRR